MPIRLLIVTPNTLLGDALARALASVEEFEVVGILSELDAATVEAASEADIIALDANFPEAPLRFVTEVREQVPNARIVIVQAPEFPQHVLPYIEAGAVGHVQSSDSFPELISILRTVHQGGAAIDPNLANLVIRQMIQLSKKLGAPLSPSDADHDLSPRELEVLAVAAEGNSNAEIGEILFIQEGTVKNHMHNILRKLDLRDRGQAALWYSQWRRLQHAEDVERETDTSVETAEKATEVILEPSEYVQRLSKLAHPRGLIFAATAVPQVRAGLERALDLLCAQLKWPIGHFLLLDESLNMLTSSGIWKLPSYDSFPNLQMAAAELQIPGNYEIAGVPLAQGEPIWITDIQRERVLLPLEVARDESIHSGLLIPLLLDRTVIGVLAFFSTRIEPPPPVEVLEGLVEASIEVSEFIDEHPSIAPRARNTLEDAGTSSGRRST
jgi:DNA-binding NarL/FixJ family response regulator